MPQLLLENGYVLLLETGYALLLDEIVPDAREIDSTASTRAGESSGASTEANAGLTASTRSQTSTASEG